MEKWSKLKKKIEELISEDLRGRIHFYATVYRKTHDQRGKVWIELDKKIIFEANTLEWEKAYFTLSDELRRTSKCMDYNDEKQSKGYYQAYDDAENILRRKHKIDEFQFYSILKRYLNSHFKDSLKAEDDLTRIFCLLDRRLGKRRLLNFRVKKDDCEAIKILYQARCQTTGIYPKEERECSYDS